MKIMGIPTLHGSVVFVKLADKPCSVRRSIGMQIH